MAAVHHSIEHRVVARHSRGGHPVSGNCGQRWSSCGPRGDTCCHRKALQRLQRDVEPCLDLWHGLWFEVGRSTRPDSVVNGRCVILGWWVTAHRYARASIERHERLGNAPVSSSVSKGDGVIPDLEILQLSTLFPGEAANVEEITEVRRYLEGQREIHWPLREVL